jgi:hypothetical protein
MSTTDIVQKLWNLCHVPRDDGITYHQYVTELTHLLFLKMTKETEQDKNLPKGYRWGDLEAREGVELNLATPFADSTSRMFGRFGEPRCSSFGGTDVCRDAWRYPASSETSMGSKHWILIARHAPATQTVHPERQR